MCRRRDCRDTVATIELGPCGEFPSPAEWWWRYCTWKGWTPEVERVAGFDYSPSKTPRCYQINAINRTALAIAGGQDRVLLVMGIDSKRRSLNNYAT